MLAIEQIDYNNKSNQLQTTKNNQQNKIQISKHPELNNIQNNGKWSLLEIRDYIRFLKTQISILKNQNKRRKNKIFQKMSTQINSRNPSQCKSYHQKMMKKYGSEDKILEFYKKKNVLALKFNFKKKNSEIIDEEQQLQQQHLIQSKDDVLDPLEMIQDLYLLKTWKIKTIYIDIGEEINLQQQTSIWEELVSK